MEAIENDGELKVAVADSPETKALVIRVTDTGPGIDPESLTHIFDPYFTTKPSGTGLGLAIVHNIIEAHHGHIIPESSPEKGTTMAIHLPLPDAADDEENQKDNRSTDE
jgi:two-component system sensor histidine kinase HydH